MAARHLLALATVVAIAVFLLGWLAWRHRQARRRKRGRHYRIDLIS